MKQGTKRFISIVLSLGLLTAAAIMYFTVIRDEYQSVMRLKAERDERARFVVEQQKNIERIQQLLNDYNGNNQAQHAVSVAVPPNPDAGNIIAQVNALAAKDNLQLQSFLVATNASSQNVTDQQAKKVVKPDSVEALKRPIGTVTFQVKFVAGYAGVKAFITDLESNLRVMDIKSITVAPADKPDRDLYTVELAVTAYYQTK